MPRPQSKGKCVYCERAFSKGSMTRHLTSCTSRKDAISKSERPTSSKQRLYHLSIEGRHNPTYWMHVEIRADAEFSQLDSFLRHIWLECCGHLSEFVFPEPKIGRGRGGPRSPWEMMSMFQEELDSPDAEMGQEIRSRVKKGDVFHHIYDFGSSTELKLKIVGERQGVLKEGEVKMLARNDPPEILCDCGRPAQHICTQCGWSGEGWLCEKCTKKHECGEDYLLPVVNSPRVGVCGYTG